MTRSWTIWGGCWALTGSSSLFMVGSCLVMRRFTWKDPRNISLLKLPDNCLIDVLGRSGLCCWAAWGWGLTAQTRLSMQSLQPLGSTWAETPGDDNDSNIDDDNDGCHYLVQLYSSSQPSMPWLWWPFSMVTPSIAWGEVQRPTRFSDWVQDIIELPANSLAWN